MTSISRSPHSSNLARSSIEPLSGSLGVQVEGLDLRKDLDEATQRELRQLLLDRLVLLFPDQRLSADDQRTLMEGC